MAAELILEEEPEVCQGKKSGVSEGWVQLGTEWVSEEEHQLRGMGWVLKAL